MRRSFAAALWLVAAGAARGGEAAGPPAPAAFEDPVSVAVDAQGRVLVGCRGAVVVMARSGERIRELGSPGVAPATGLAVDARERTIVASPERGEVVLLGPDGAAVGSAGGLSSPGQVAVGPGGAVLVAEAGASRIVVLSPGLGSVLFAVSEAAVDSGPRALKGPAGVAATGDRVAIADTGNGRVLVGPLPSPGDPVLRPEATIAPAGFEPKAIALARDGRIYAVDRGAVRGFLPDGREFGSFRARAVRMWFDPRGIAVDPSGAVLVVDGSTRRVLATTADLRDEEPRILVDPAEPTTAVVEWTTPAPRPSVVRWGPTEDCDREARDEEPKTEHRIVLTGLSPSTRYYLHVSDPVEAIPATTPPRADLALETQRKSYAVLAKGSFSGEYPFATGPGAGRAEWTSVPVIVLVYRTVTFPAGPDGTHPADRVLSDADLALLRSEMETYRVWAWRQSHLKVDLDLSWVVVDEPRAADRLGDVTPVVVEDIRRGLEAQGKRVEDFWNVIVVGTHGWYANYLAGTVAGTPYELGSCYAGFGPGTKPGWWWFPTHEHGHLIHSMVMCSGAGHFAFPDAPWTLPGKFGEDFSFLAYDWRQFPPRGWLLLKKSILRSSADGNGNGVPDDDPAVPLDERRFGWTEALGGDCMRRMMAGVRTPGFPGGTDTDFEGRVRRLVEGELHWIDRRIARSTPALDGRIADGEWTELNSIPNLTTPEELRGLRARLFAAWDEGTIYLAVSTSRRSSAGFDLDAANDGWFHGRDNLRLSARPDGPPPGAAADGAIWDFLGDTLNDHGGQLWWRGAYAAGDLRAAAGEADGWHVIECAVPARPEVGIRPGPGARFGLRAWVQAEAPDPAPPTGFLDGEDFVWDLECVPERLPAPPG